FSSTVSGGSRLGPWNAKETGPGRSDLNGPIPGHSIVPAVGRSSPAIRWSRVDFPLPDGPTTAIRSAASMSNVASARAVTAAGPSPNTLARPSARTSSSPIDDPPVGQPDDPVRRGGHPFAVGHHDHGPA